MSLVKTRDYMREVILEVNWTGLVNITWIKKWSYIWALLKQVTHETMNKINKYFLIFKTIYWNNLTEKIYEEKFQEPLHSFYWVSPNDSMLHNQIIYNEPNQ